MLIVIQVELEMAINTTSPNYSRSKGEQIALNVDGTGYDETNTYSAYVHCQTLFTLETVTNLFATASPCEFPITHCLCLVIDL